MFGDFPIKRIKTWRQAARRGSQISKLDTAGGGDTRPVVFPRIPRGRRRSGKEIQQVGL